MSRLTSIAVLALASSYAAARNCKATRQLDNAANAPVVTNVTLSPIPAPAKSDCLVPKTNVSLDYGLQNAGLAAVNVTLSTNYPTILLETIHNLTAVDCSSDSVALTFNNAQDLDEAHTQWSTHDKLLLITNHMGDCDTEHERGFFLAGTYTANTSSLTLTATAEKTDVNNTSSYMKTQFNGLPAASTADPSRRDIVVKPSKLTYDHTWSLPSKVLYEHDPYVTVTAKSAELELSVGLSGYLEFDVRKMHMEAMYVDFETAVQSDLVLELDVTAPYKDSFTYSPDALVYYVVNVPGIVTFGPELLFSVGADLDISADVNVVMDVGADIANGTIHIDFVDAQATGAQGWEPTYHANISLSEKAAVDVNPYVSFTAGIEFKVLGGSLDLSGGLTPKLSFPTAVTLDAGQDVGAGSGASTTVTQPGPGGVCTNGAAVTSDFDFSLTAYATQWFNQVVYNTTVPIADKCYSWA